MKRIIIPAGTMSEKKDYILEIPADPNVQDNLEDTIYILDEKSSKDSVRSLSEYFYEESDNVNQEYVDVNQLEQQMPVQNQTPLIRQSSIQQQQVPIQQHSQSAPVYERTYQKPQNYVPKNYSEQYHKDFYYYYRSLGYTNEEIHALLSRKSNKNYPRRQMKFNRLTVSDFLGSNEDNSNQNHMDAMANPNNLPSNNIEVDNQDKITYSNPNYSSYDQTVNLQYSNISPYNYYNVKSPPQIQRYPRNTAPVSEYQTVNANVPYATGQVRGIQQTQGSSNEPVYYQRSLSRTTSPIRRRISNTDSGNLIQENQKVQPSRSYNQDNTATYAYPDDFKYQTYQENTYKTLPGTSVISNSQNIKVKNAE